MKPNQQISGIQPHSFLNALDDRISFSPDSVLEPSLSSHSDIDLFSQASHITSQLSGFPKYPTDAKVSGLVRENIDALKRRMPFKISIERDVDDKENLSISAIVDNEGNDVIDGNLEIHIQSLGVEDQYWLDSGAFDF